MLVKLGNLWVNPTKVEGIRVHYSLEDGEEKFTGSDFSFAISIFTGAESGLIAEFCPTSTDANILLDNYAAIINNAVGSSYGGADEEEIGAPA